MKRVLVTILGTAAIFAAGVFAGLWIQRHQPVPPPPMGLMGELRDLPLTGNSKPAPQIKSTEQLQAEIERTKNASEAFKQKLEPIKAEFRRNLESLLTPEQMATLKEFRERGSNTPSVNSDGQPAPAKPKSKDHEGLDAMFPIVLVPVTLERITEKLSLTPEQQAQVKIFLLKRRQQFLDLVDTSPPPSMKLSRIAPLVPQIAQPHEK
ncbi:MAG TPA: hypothetical protein VFT72_08810 [Opitutaceae bacterium]|nr:hypothetical protein [Opitutaceae bacterium]